MAYKIKKSKEFLKNTLFVLNYIEKEWGIKSAERFQTLLDSKIDKLSIHAKTGSLINKNKNIRKLMITKHNKIYYRINKNEINILTLFENKMDPKKNKYE